MSEQGGVTIRVQAFDNLGNEGAWSAPVHYYYDATNPIHPTPISTSHAISTWNKDRTIDVSWSGASDGALGSGVDGFYTEWNTDTTIMTGPVIKEYAEETVSSETSPTLATGQNHYFHIATVDNAGNWTSQPNISGRFGSMQMLQLHLGALL